MINLVPAGILEEDEGLIISMGVRRLLIPLLRRSLNTVLLDSTPCCSSSNSSVASDHPVRIVLIALTSTVSSAFPSLFLSNQFVRLL